MHATAHVSMIPRETFVFMAIVNCRAWRHAVRADSRMRRRFVETGLTRTQAANTLSRIHATLRCATRSPASVEPRHSGRVLRRSVQCSVQYELRQMRRILSESLALCHATRSADDSLAEALRRRSGLGVTSGSGWLYMHDAGFLHAPQSIHVEDAERKCDITDARESARDAPKGVRETVTLVRLRECLICSGDHATCSHLS